MRVHPTCPSSSGALVLTCANPCHARVCIRDPLSCSPAPALGNGSKLNRKRAERSCTCALLKASLHAHGLCTAEILSVACPLSQLARPTLGTSGAIPFAMLQSTRCQRGMVTNADARACFIAHNAIEYVDPPQRKGVGLRSVAPAPRRPYLSECLAPIIGALHHSPAWCNRKL